ncbi:MAG TPA: hypothetical protein VFY71_11385 [Planctomycetota bacterium]|nr:hypothetical protein [Planctomycetota bacterium]
MNVRLPLLRAAAFPATVLLGHLVLRARIGPAVNWAPLNVATHMLGGLAVAHLVGVALGPVLDTLRGRTRALVRAVGIVTLTTTVAVLWEFAECVMARIHGVLGPSAGGDTLRDIAAGMAGAAAYAAISRLARAGGAQAQAA